MEQKQPKASSGLACIVLTTMGRVLLQCERDTTLPFKYPHLALLLASCLQFATDRQEYVRLDLQGGYSVVLSVDGCASVACAVIVKDPQATELARLQSLVVLREFTRVFRKRVEQIVEANRVASAEMAEAYTLTSALGGDNGRGAGGGDGYDDEDGTLEEFLAFHHQFVAPVLESAAFGHGWRSTIGKSDSITVLEACVLNGESGAHVLESRLTVSPSAEINAHTSQELVRRATRALHLAFPVLCAPQPGSASQLEATLDSSGTDPACSSGRPSPTTLVLQFKSRNSDGASYYVAIRMFHVGVFASVVHYHASSPCSRFRGKYCELVTDGGLRRVLTSDSRGAAFVQLLRAANRSTCFSLHVGSDGVPEPVAQHLDCQLQSWRMRFTT